MAHLDRLCLNKVDRREQKLLLAIFVHDCTRKSSFCMPLKLCVVNEQQQGIGI